MCSLLRFCVRLSWSALASAWPSMPVHSELSVPRLYSKRRQSSNAATTSSAHFHDQCLALPIRFQSQPDCPTAPMPLLYPRLRCALTELHCASSLRRGDPLPIHAPSLLSKVRAIARIWISRVNGNIISSFPDFIYYWQQKVRGLASHLAPALAHLHDRPCHHDSLTTPWP